MNRELVDRVVNAVLYEGYILYPYRASSKKNQRERFTFGRVYPRDYSKAQNDREPCWMQTECLVRNESRDSVLKVNVRFLQPSAREIGKLRAAGGRPEIVPELTIDNELYQTWQEAIEREVEVPAISLNETIRQSREFEFPAARTVEPIGDGRVGVIVRRNQMIRGRTELQTQMVDEAALKISVRIFNETPVSKEDLDDQNEVLRRTFASTHTILHAAGGKFISLLDPSPEYEIAAKECQNIGCWPVLVGEQAKRDAMLSSPIILYDYPKIAVES